MIKYEVCYIPEHGDIILYDDGDDVALWEMIYTGGTYLMFSDGNFITISTDCINWTSKTGTTIPDGQHYNNMSYGNGIILLISYDYLTGTTSTDKGQTWTSGITMSNGIPINLGTSNYFFNGKFYSNTGTDIYTSTDGFNWINEMTYYPPSTTTINGFHHFASSDNTIAFFTSTKIFYNVNNTGWNSYNNSFYNQHTTTCAIGALCYGNGKWVAIHNGEGGPNHPFPSSDMIWYNDDISNSAGWVATYQAFYQFQNTASTTAFRPWAGIVFGNNGFLVGGDAIDGAKLIYSPDGINWTAAVPPNEGLLVNVVGYGDGIYFFNQGGTPSEWRTCYSNNLITWTDVMGPYYGYFSSAFILNDGL